MWDMFMLLHSMQICILFNLYEKSYAFDYVI